MMNKTTGFQQHVAGGFGAVASAFVIESIEHIIPWLMVTCAVICCDLVCGLRKSMLMKEDIRFSSAVRRTMGKMVTYFAFVVMVCMIDVAAGNSNYIDKWACLLVCFIESTSIISNILKPKGYDVNVLKLLALGISKITKVDKEDIQEVIEKPKNNGKE